ncbi:hypothetical protein JKP88DRAFT_242214 [Tribonema minus]|uniref:Uncharacterized protein n=1 Tax=Tribonema minus TaxID=303371 RepID=A0A835YPX8_9STRA|nr:hypothetical protein JKP88DRAFT_242214 [Tribonema minus]
MHGYTYRADGSDHRDAYGYLIASLEPVSSYRQRTLEERGRGAVTGGFIYKSSDDSRTPWKEEQTWGTVHGGSAQDIGFFYSSSDRTLSYRPAVCFSAIRDEAPIVALWRNNKVEFGPNLDMNKKEWGSNISSFPDTGKYGLTLAEIESVKVLQVTFPGIDDSMRNLAPEIVDTKTYTNHHSREATCAFEFSRTFNHQFSFGFKEGFDIMWSSKWEANVFYIGKAEATFAAKLTFEANQLDTTGEATTHKDTVTIAPPPKSAVRAEAVWTRGTLDLEAQLTMLIQYKNGVEQTITQPVNYRSVSVFDLKVAITPLTYSPQAPQASFVDGGTVEQHIMRL